MKANQQYQRPFNRDFREARHLIEPRQSAPSRPRYEGARDFLTVAQLAAIIDWLD
jgi:hypothetical protein